MLIIAIIILFLWFLSFLASAGSSLRPLPPPREAVPPYVLWVPENQGIPDLEPAPLNVIHDADQLPDEGFVLRLGAGISVASDLPGRLAACDGDLISSMPRPSAGVLAVAAERHLRDAVRVEAVNKITEASAYADSRCTWFNVRDLALPSPRNQVVLGLAQGRKSHGLSVDLRDGCDAGGRPLVVAGDSSTDVMEQLARIREQDPLARYGAVLTCFGLYILPILGLVADSLRSFALLALALGVATSLMVALRDRFGWSLAILGWGLEPYLSYKVFRHTRTLPLETAPDFSVQAPIELTGVRRRPKRHWYHRSSVVAMANQVGQSAHLMERIYEGRAAGPNLLDWLLDRWVQHLPPLRALRWRWVMAGRWVQELKPQKLLSVPCGTARSIERLRAESIHLVDVEPEASFFAEQRCPQATMFAGSVDDVPEGPYDVILYLGLTESIGDAELRRHLEHLRRHLITGGFLVVSVTAHHRHRILMENWLGWKSRIRTPQQLSTHLEATGFRVHLIGHDPHKIQWLMAAQAHES